MVFSSLSATCRAHLLCSRCCKGIRGSSSGCSGTGPLPDSRRRPRSSSCGSPRGPWQRFCRCSRPGHIRGGGARLLVARGTHHLHCLLFDWPWNTFDCVKRGEALLSTLLWNLVIGPAAPPGGETAHLAACNRIDGPDCRHSRSPPLWPGCCLRPPPRQILSSGQTARGYLCAALRSILIQGIRIFLKRDKQDLLSLSLSLFKRWNKTKGGPGQGFTYLFWMFSGWHLPTVEDTAAELWKTDMFTAVSWFPTCSFCPPVTSDKQLAVLPLSGESLRSSRGWRPNWAN